MPAGTSTSSVRSSIDPARSATLLAGLLDALAGAAARAGTPRADELAEDAAGDLLSRPLPPQVGQVVTARARLGAAAAAARARHRDIERNVALRSRRRVDELDLDVAPRCRRRARGRRAADAEEVVAEERGEEVGQAAEVELRRLEPAAPQPRVAEAVVEVARLGLREHLVGLDDLAEPLLGVRRVGDVGMQLAGEARKAS